MDETSVMRRVWLRMAARCTLWRMNSGKGWVGSGKARRDAQGNVILPGGRPISLGFTLVNGDAVSGPGDLIGFARITVTPEMVGHSIPVFATFECKPTVRPHYRESQQHFADVVKDAGGIAGIVNSPEGAEQVYDEFLRRFHAPLG